MSITDADRLAYNNLPTITLKDGRTLELHYGYGGFKVIEERFGSVGYLMAELQKGIDGKLFSVVFGGLYAGLWRTRISEEEFEQQLDLSDLEKHAELLSEALMLAFPQKAQEKAEDEPSKESPNLLPGPTTPTSQPASLDSHLISSGN